jgi:glycosyltransferase involved in cell wall biosynthesis
MRLGIVYHMPFWRDAAGGVREVEGSFARYVDSLAPYFDEIVLCVPVVENGRGEGTPIRSSNVVLAPLPAFDGPAQFYPKLPLMAMPLARFVASIDVLHCRVPTPAAIFAFAAARIAAKPVFLLVVGDLAALRDTLPYRGAKRALWRAYTAFEEWAVQRMADRSLTFANGAALTAKHSRRGRPVVETRTTTIDARDIATRLDSCGQETIRVLTVSRIDPRKGLRVLPEVVRLLRAGGRRVSLDIVGPTVGSPGDAEARAIREESERLQVADAVRLLGPVPLDRLLARYREYDLFVLPTRPGEGIPRVLLEAMTAGLPVVTTAVAGIPGLVGHERNGLLVETPTAAALASAIERLIVDGPLRRRLIANGYDTARGHTLQAQASSMMATVGARLGIALRAPAAVPAA